MDQSNPIAKLSSFHPFLILWLSSLAIIWGFSLFGNFPSIMVFFLPIAYITVILALFEATRFYRDCLNPLSTIIVLSLVRLCIPGLMILLGMGHDISIFELMKLNRNDLVLGHSLALIGLLGVIIGWFLPLKFPSILSKKIFTSLRIGLPKAVCYTAAFGMLIGFIALCLFIGSNTSITEAILTGSFRNTEIQEGTGKYFHLSLILISGSVVYSAYLAKSECSWLRVILPVMLASAAFWVLGGRGRSLTPFVAGLLLLWYRQDRLKLSLRRSLTLISIIVFLIILLVVGRIYRGVTELAVLLQEVHLDFFIELIEATFLTDIGLLHPLAGAVVLGPGVLSGKTFLTMLWPLSNILGLSGRSAGIFIIDELIGMSGNKWGLGVMIIGEAYLNFGWIGVIILTITYGLIFKAIYLGFRHKIVPDVIFVFIMVYGIQDLFFGSIEKFGQTALVLGFAFLIIKLGKVLDQLRIKESLFGSMLIRRM